MSTVKSCFHHMHDTNSGSADRQLEHSSVRWYLCAPYQPVCEQVGGEEWSSEFLVGRWRGVASSLFRFFLVVGILFGKGDMSQGCAAENKGFSITLFMLFHWHRKFVECSFHLFSTWLHFDIFMLDKVYHVSFMRQAWQPNLKMVYNSVVIALFAKLLSPNILWVCYKVFFSAVQMFDLLRVKRIKTVLQWNKCESVLRSFKYCILYCPFWWKSGSN